MEGLELLVTYADTTLRCFLADEHISDHFIHYLLPDNGRGPQAGLDLLQLGRGIHAKDLLVLTVLYILPEQLGALEGYARLKLSRGDLFTVHFSHRLELLQYVEIQVAVPDDQDNSRYHANGDVLDEPDLTPFAFKAGDMFFTLDFGIRCHNAS